jgi:ABC-type phosphate transport system permease subunit
MVQRSVGGVGVRDAPSVGDRAAQRGFALSMVGNVIMMLIIVMALTFGGFLYMDYLSEREQNKMLTRKIEAVKRAIAGCQKE